MKKISILFLLLMGLCLPWAANAQEQNMLNDNAADNGGRGTKKVYKKVSTLTSNKNYLIVSSQTANSNAYALSQTSSTASTITGFSVHINDGNSHTNNAVYIVIDSDNSNTTAVWTATSSSSAWRFSHSNSGTTYSVYTNSTYSNAGTLSANTTATNWTLSTSTNQLSITVRGGFFNLQTKTYYITPSGSSFTVGTSSANVYFFEETDLTVFDITATVSPSGIGGTVTGTGQYFEGATCELTATTNNSEYAFVNWTNENGSVFSTNPCSFTVRADQNLVAHFESTVDCLAPTNAAVINQSITAHTAALNWTENGEASQWQVVYSTDANFDPNSATPTLVSNNPYTITGLAQSTTYYAYVRAYCDANHQSAWSNQVTFSTIAGNQPPTNLTLGIPEPHGITLSWTGVTTNTNHQNFEVYYSTSSIVPSADIASGYEIVNTNSCTLSGLIPETTYYAWVRDNCGSDGKSAWVAFNPFTTGIACYAPGLTYSDVESHTAQLTFSGSTDTYNVRFAELVPSTPIQVTEDFSGSYTLASYNANGVLPTGWVGVKTGSYLPHITNNATLGTTYDIVNIGGGQSGTDNFLYFVSASTAIMPLYSNITAVSFQYCCENANQGTFTVGYCTENTDGTSFTALTNNGSSFTPGSTSLTTVTLTADAIATINAHNGYIAFKWAGTTNYGLAVDNITIAYQPLTLGSWTYRNDITDNPYILSGLSSETNYQVEAQSVCGGIDGNSQWSEAVTFTTEVACPTPTNLATTNGSVTARTATLTWSENGSATNWVVEYATNSSFTEALTQEVNTNPTTQLTDLVPETTYFARVKAICGGIDGESLYSNTVSFTTEVACPTPTNLATTNGSVTSHTATLTWEENGLATNWVVEYASNSSFTEALTQEVNTNPTTQLTDLVPETTYFARVKAICGGIDGESLYSNTVSFTTGIACFAPTNLTASNVTNNTAVISWTGEAESFNVRYREISSNEIIFKDDFENGLGRWTIYTEGDANAWRTTDPSEGLSWAGHNGSTNVAISMSWNNNAYTANNWLVTPEVQLSGMLKFYVYTNQQYPDEYEVKLSTGGNSISDFTVTLQEMASIPTTGDWVEVNIDLSSYQGQSGYIAIHHDFYDGNYIIVDDFGIYGIGEWTNTTCATNSIEITGLDDYTDYEVQVQGNCGSFDGLSQWSASASFQTIDNCTAPFSLNYTDATCIGATLSWEGIQDSYNVQYRSVISPIVEGETTEGFEDATEFSEWQAFGNVTTNTDNNRFGRLTGAAHLGSYGFSFSSYSRADDYNQYLISPLLDDDVYFIDFYYKSSSASSSGELFKVGYSSTGSDVEDFTWSEEYSTKETSWSHFEDNNVPEGTKYMAIHYYANYQYQLYIDDITFKSYTPGVYGPWVTESNVTSPLEVTGLMPTTNYEWQVQGVDCDGNGGTTEWSEVATFTTLPAYKKTIEPYEGDGGYYLIASPLASAVNPATVGMITDELGAGATAETSTYDFYFFDQTNNKEWINYREAPFNMENGKGYLYANKGGITLTFADTPYSGNGQVELVYSDVNDDENMRGWNLVGNPFAQTAYIDMPFYTLNGNAEFIENEAGTPIEAMQGILVYTNANATLTFSTEPAANRANLALSLSKDRAVIDRAILSFNESSQLPKFQLRESSTKVYIPQDGKDYSVVNAANVDNMPVNFKAETNGTYTFSFNAEEVSFGYLHLIDNMNGNDVDLLATPSYSFEAKATDRENRFKLVFATGNNANDDAFAFYCNGSFIINNEGEATLQVIDMNGRIMKSESINGCANINVNAAQGIYMLRLMNGENVKVQKIVVR